MSIEGHILAKVRLFLSDIQWKHFIWPSRSALIFCLNQLCSSSHTSHRRLRQIIRPQVRPRIAAIWPRLFEVAHPCLVCHRLKVTTICTATDRRGIKSLKRSLQQCCEANYGSCTICGIVTSSNIPKKLNTKVPTSLSIHYPLHLSIPLNHL